MHVYQIGGRRVEGAGESAAWGSGERSPEGGHGRPRIIFSTSERLFWVCLGDFSNAIWWWPVPVGYHGRGMSVRMSSTGCSPAFPRVLKGLRLAAEEVPEGCKFRTGRRLLPLNNLPDRDLVRVGWIGRGTGQFRSERGRSRRTSVGCGASSAGSDQLVLEMLL